MVLVAIIGRPNVGKSTLFNRIAGRRRALVDDFPGVTRDRNETEVVWDEKRFLLADTAGYGVSGETALEEGTLEQVRRAIDEADVLLFVADAKTGLHPEDHSLVQLVRRSAKPTFFAVNKIDGPEQARHMAEFFELGIDRIYPISAAHGFGVGDLLTDLAEAVPEDVVAGTTQGSRLEWVGRNHGRRKAPKGGFDDRRTNFLYVDGHVETKHVKDTLVNFQWGDRFFSLNAYGDMAP